MSLNSGDGNESVPNVSLVGMRDSKLVLQDEDEESVVTELEELSAASEQNVGPTAINIENSKDVIVGPVTQFHGPVTIYQNVNGAPAIEAPGKNKDNCSNGKLIKSESAATEAFHVTEKPTKNSFLHSKHLKYIGIPIILIIMIVIIVCAVILSSKSEERKPSVPDPSKTDFSEDSGSLEPIGSGSLITRAKWGALPSLNTTQPLQHPTPLVIISHTASSFCKAFAECSIKVAAIQAYHLNQRNFPDIGYNFLVGGDANVYVGRGWDVKNFHSINSIGISFIGNYITDHLSEAMIASAKALIYEGLTTGKLAGDYKIVCHNQTYATQSPGRNIYAVVKTWPHFDPRSYLNN